MPHHSDPSGLGSVGRLYSTATGRECGLSVGEYQYDLQYVPASEREENYSHGDSTMKCPQCKQEWGDVTLWPLVCVCGRKFEDAEDEDGLLYSKPSGAPVKRSGCSGCGPTKADMERA